MPIRTVRLSPPRSSEALGVLRASGAIVVLMVVFAGARTEEVRPVRAPLEFEVAFESLPPDQQTVGREVRLALDEILNLRAETGAWPAPWDLEEQGIAPFAPIRLVGRVVRHRWDFQQTPPLSVYVGRPESEGAWPSWLLRLDEAVDTDPAHQALAGQDGTHFAVGPDRIVHASIWVMDAGRGDVSASERPEREGWRRVAFGRPTD